MISSPTRKYRLTQLPFRKVIGENAIRAHVLIKPSISHGITGIRRLSVLGDLVSQGRGMWRLGTDSRAETHLGTKEAAQRLQAAGGPTARQLQPPQSVSPRSFGCSCALCGGEGTHTAGRMRPKWSPRLARFLCRGTYV